MKISENTYQLIIKKCLNNQSETGGIIGGKNNIVTEFVFDKGTALSSKQHYYPNVERLNECINDWKNINIQFYGIVHTHLQKERLLSIGDKQYIRTIMLTMPVNVRFLYFPIVLPQNEIVAYEAVRLNNEININASNIKIIYGKEKSNEKN